MKNFKSYIETKKELELIKLNLEALTKKEKYILKEKEELLILEQELDNTLTKIENSLKNLKGIEKELLYELLIKGRKATRAVEIVAFKNDLDSSTIWKGYYPKIKKIMQNLE